MKLFKPQLKIIKGNEAGFAILEGLIAAAIFGVAMAAVVYTMAGAMRTNAIARDISQATSLGADVIERISILPYADLDLQNNTFTEPDSPDGKYAFTINTQLDAVLDNTMSITVRVRWQDKGRQRQVIISDTKVNFI